MAESDFIGPGGLHPDEAFSALAAVIKVGLDFKYRRRFLEPAAVRATVDALALESLPKTPQSLSEVLSTLESDYLPQFANLATPNFAGFPDSGNSVAGVAGAILGELLNPNVINAVICGPGATEMELSVIRWLRELVGFPNESVVAADATHAGGVPTPGGTGANFMATLLALNRSSPSRQAEGSGEGTRGVILVPEGIGHYTMVASASWSGAGAAAVRKVAIDGFRYDLAAVDRELRRMRDGGEKLAMAVAYAGDSRTMTVDRLGDFAETVRGHYPNAWLHCDGCHGTSLIFSELHRAALTGIADYDSVSLDPHKVLAVPYPCSFLLVRDTRELRLVETTSELILKQSRSMGRVTPGVGSRAFHSLRLWMLLKTLGVQGVGEMIDRRMSAAQDFAALVDRNPRFVRFNDVDLNAVAFTVLPEGVTTPCGESEVDASAALTRRVFDSMVADGEYYLHHFELLDSNGVLSPNTSRSHPVLRYMSGNPLMTAEIQGELLAHFERLAS